MIKNVPYASSDRDIELRRTIGTTLKGLAFDAVGLDEDEMVLEDYLAAAVPVTSGKGVTAGFSESVAAIAEHLGMRTMVTRRADVAGLSDALAAKADIVFMADDEEFVALNVHAGRCADNTRSTALGYVTALRRAAGPLTGRKVLLIGAGRVGTRAGELLAAEGAAVTVVDADESRAEALRQRYRGFTACRDLEEAVRGSDLILNASPARIPGEWIQEGAVVSSPGMPFSFDDEGLRRMRVLIHDPLQIGVSVMAVWSASLSRQPAVLPARGRAWLEVMS